MYTTINRMFEINYSYKEPNKIRLVGQTEKRRFTVEILSVGAKKEYENHEGDMYISDNNGGMYNIKIKMEVDQYATCGSVQKDFNYVNYDIPAYVWCIVTGMILAKL